MRYTVNMESFIIAAKDKKIRDQRALAICKENVVDTFDITTVERDGSIGIEEVRLLHKKLYLAPLKGKMKAIIFTDANMLTLEAQNALLKILEEPPNNTIIILTVENKNLLLPTVLSRCKIIEFKSSENQSESSDFLSLAEYGVGERLKLAQDIAKNKDGAIAWLENMILSLRQELIKNPSNPSLFIIHYSLFQKTYVTLKTTNANPRLALETLFLNM